MTSVDVWILISEIVPKVEDAVHMSHMQSQYVDGLVYSECLLWMFMSHELS